MLALRERRVTSLWTPQQLIDDIKFLIINLHYISFHGARAPSGSGPHYRDFAITLRHITLGRTPQDE